MNDKLLIQRSNSGSTTMYLMYKKMKIRFLFFNYLLFLNFLPLFCQGLKDQAWQLTGTLPRNCGICDIAINEMNIIAVKVEKNYEHYVAFSSDYGNSWLFKPSPERCQVGRIFAEGRNFFLTTLLNDYKFTTKNLGETWSKIEDAILGSPPQDSYIDEDTRVIKSVLNGNDALEYKFYARNNNGWVEFIKGAQAKPGFRNFLASETIIEIGKKDIFFGGITNTPFQDAALSFGARIYTADVGQPMYTNTIDGNGISVSTNNGKSWEKYFYDDIIKSISLFKVCKSDTLFANANFVNGQSQFCVSIDGAKTWKALENPGGKKVLELFYLNDGSILVKNEDYQLFKSNFKLGCVSICGNFLSTSNSKIKNYWEEEAFKHIKDTDSQVIKNQGITCAYAKMYLKNPSRYKWAGLAALVSGKIGIEEQTARWKPDIIGLMTSIIAGNRAVYHDLFWQHLAFEKNGISEMEKLYCENSISRDEYFAWKKISIGNVWEGNRDLLLHEQRDILQPNLYENHPNSWYLSDTWGGLIVNWGNVLKSPVPNDDSKFTSGLNQNIANFNQRWSWIDNHILPKWKEFESNKINKPILMQHLKNVCPTIE